MYRSASGLDSLSGLRSTERLAECKFKGSQGPELIKRYCLGRYVALEEFEGIGGKGTRGERGRRKVRRGGREQGLADSAGWGWSGVARRWRGRGRRARLAATGAHDHEMQPAISDSAARSHTSDIIVTNNAHMSRGRRDIFGSLFQLAESLIVH
jgi:hypothetical protein